MADKYPNFETLSENEVAGADYRILARRAAGAFAVVAPHGGGIEPGTTEIADAIGGEEFTFYSFGGIKRTGNADLHITSTKFNEPICLTLIAASDVVVTIHGEESEADGEGVFLGGLDETTGRAIGSGLQAAGFDVRVHPDPGLQGRDPENICNQGKTGAGVQLELSFAVRKTMFQALTREGRKQKTPQFWAFVNAVRSVLCSQSQRCRALGQGQG